EAVNIVGGVQIAAVDGKDVISGLDVDAGLGERSLVAGIPVFSVVNLGDSVTIIFETIVGAEQAASQLLRFGGFATADEHVTDCDLAEAFLEKISKFGARGDAVEVRRVFLLSLVEIEAVIVRIVEKIAFDAPGLVVDLFPHSAGLDVDFPAIELERAETGLGRATAAGSVVDGRSDPGVALAVENFFAVEGNGEVVD